MHRRTVRQAMASPVPPERKTPVRAAPVREAVAGWIDEMLREDLAAPRKQRHTARRVFERLVDEHGAQVSYSYVAKYVARRRAEITAQDGDGAEGLAGFVPQAREPGAEAEVDFGDVTVELDGRLARCSCSRCGCRTRARAATGRLPARRRRRSWKATWPRSRRLGGVPARQIRYDNLAPAVARCWLAGTGPRPQRWLRSGRFINLFPQVPWAHCFPCCSWQRPDLESSGRRYRFEHSWRFFGIPEFPSAIYGVFRDR